MRRARVAFSGAIHCAVPDGEGRLRLEDGRRVTEAEVVWLPPLEAGTILALGLNYADHAKELAFNAQEEPLVFLKGPGSLLGHRGCTRRPAQVKFMHYECELAVVIGRPAKNVSRAAAMDHVADTASPTTTRSAITWKTGTAPTCASRIATEERRSGRGWSTRPMSRIPPASVCEPSSTASCGSRETRAIWSTTSRT